MKKIYPRKKKHLTLTSSDLYLLYTKYKEGDRYILSYNKWKSIVFSCLRELGKLVIRENLVLDLWAGMGKVGVIKKKSFNRKRIDYAATKRNNKLIFHRNLHTDGFYFCIKWLRTKLLRRKGENAKFYIFTAIPDAKNKEVGSKGLGAWILKCANDPYIKDYDAPTYIV